MGAAASLSDDCVITLEKAKELASEKWTEEMETKCKTALGDKEGLPLSELKTLAPELFANDVVISKEDAEKRAIDAGHIWSEELSILFDSAATDGKLALSNWKSLAPKLFETEEERKAREAAEFEALLKEKAEGNVVINYQMYNEEFPISANTLTAARIDEDYGLTDVMPGCRIRLAKVEGKAALEYDGKGADPWVREDPIATFRDLLAGEKYYCIVIEDPVQYEKDQAAMREKLALSEAAESTEKRKEGCSCLYGNPCVDQYVCLDWDNRMAVATKNGWKGF